MAHRQRSPLGELVYAYRTARNLTQAQLAGSLAAQDGPAGDRVSVRTISNIERRYAPHESWIVAQQATVDILAAHFNLARGSTEWHAFQAAARATQDSANPELAADPGDGFISAGREGPLRRLEQSLDALADGHSGLLLIAGEAGAGKTSLMLHAVRSAVERHDNLVVLWGSSTPESHPFQPMVQMTGASLAMLEHASAEHLVSERNRQRLRERAGIVAESIANDGRVIVDRLVPMAGLEASDVNPQVANVLTEIRNVGTVPSFDEQEFMQQAWLAIQRYAVPGPVVMVYDNLHLADEGTAALLLEVIRRLQHSAAPMLIIGSYRPLELRPVPGIAPPPFADALRELSHSAYDPIINLGAAIGGHQGRAYVKDVIESRVEDAPETLIDEVFRLTEGLPLFVDAVLRWYQTGNTIRRATPDEPLRWDELVADLPAEIDTVLGDLFARLSPKHRHMLQAASVQGPLFSADVLQATLAVSRATLIDDLVTYLADEVNVVQQAGTRIIGGHKSFDFTFFHSLLRDFIYRNLDPSFRRDLHRQAGQAMISLWGDDVHQGAMHIARQFDQAGDPATAIAWYLRAGDYHLIRHEHQQAIPFYQRIQDMNALEIAPFFTVQAKVGLGNCARGLGRLGLAQEHLANASAMARQHDLPLVEANSLTSLGMVQFDLGQMEATALNLAEAVEILQQVGDDTELCRALALLSHALHGQGCYEDSMLRAEQAMALAEDMDRDDLYVHGLVAKAECLLAIGDFNGAIALASRGHVIAEEYGDSPRMALCALVEGHAWLEMEDTLQATRAFDHVFALRQSVNGRRIGAAWFGRGMVSLRNGDLDDARNQFRESLRRRRRHDQHALRVDSEVGLLRVALANGSLEVIRRRSDSIQQRIAQIGPDGVQYPAHLFLALWAAGNALADESMATDAIRRGQELIHRRAALLTDPDRRRRYLHDVRANRALLGKTST